MTTRRFNSIDSITTCLSIKSKAKRKIPRPIVPSIKRAVFVVSESLLPSRTITSLVGAESSASICLHFCFHNIPWLESPLSISLQRFPEKKTIRLDVVTSQPLTIYQLMPFTTCFDGFFCNLLLGVASTDLFFLRLPEKKSRNWK